MQDMALLTNFRDNLRKACRDQGITMAELAERSGVHYVTISKILNGRMNPSIDICEKLAIHAKMRPDTAFLAPLADVEIPILENISK